MLCRIWGRVRGCRRGIEDIRCGTILNPSVQWACVHFWEKSDYVSLDRELRRIESLKKSGMWVSKASVMRNSIPELRELADN